MKMANTNIPTNLAKVSDSGSIGHVTWDLPIKSGYVTELLVANLSTGPYFLQATLPEGVTSAFVSGNSTIFVKVRSKRNVDGVLSNLSDYVMLRLTNETAETLAAKIADIHDTIGSTQKSYKATLFQAEGLLAVGAVSVDYSQLTNVVTSAAYTPIIVKSIDVPEIGVKTIEKLDLDLVFHGCCEDDCRWRWEIGAGASPSVWAAISEEILHTGVAFATPGGTPITADYVEKAIKGIRSFDESATFPFTIRLVAKLEAGGVEPVYTRILSSSLIEVTYNVA
jgi:hypothetical protein